MKSADATTEPRGDEASARRLRRVFVERGEIAGLVLGTARADPIACRRVLGARRSGRIGLLLALAGLALCAPDLPAAFLAALVHVVLGLLVGIGARGHSGHTTREVQRLAIWTVLTPLGVAVLARLAGFGAPGHALAAAVIGQVLLVRALRATRAA